MTRVTKGPDQATPPGGMGMTNLPDLDALWDYSRPAESARRMRSVLAGTEVSSDPAYRSSLLTQIARTLGLQGQFAEGHALLDEVETIAPAAPAEPRLRLLLERGRLHNSAGEPEAARPLFAQAWEAARRAGEDGFAVDAAHMLAIVGQGDDGLRWNRSALELAEASADPRARRWRASLHNNLGWTRHDRGEFDVALEHFEGAVVLRAEAGKAPELRMARWCVGRALRSLGRIREALAIQQGLFAQAKAEALEEDGYVSEEIGECLLALGQPEAARPHFARACALLSQASRLVQQEPQRIARLKGLAESGEG